MTKEIIEYEPIDALAIGEATLRYERVPYYGSKKMSDKPTCPKCGSSCSPIREWYEDGCWVCDACGFGFREKEKKQE